MRGFIALASCAALAASISGCAVGSGEIVSETRAVEGFDEIDLRGTGEVRITVDGTESLAIEAEDNIIGHLTSGIRGSTLVLGVDRPIAPTTEIIYTVTMMSLEGIEISGSGSVAVSEFATEGFLVDIGGSGSADVTEVVAASVSVRISGSGSVTIGGEAADLDLSISGSGAFDGERLEATSGSVDISGSGSATVNVSEILDVAISGSGSVQYIGDPSLAVDASGSGSVSRR